MKKKKIWIMNHYATGMFFNKGGRHYWFAENLFKHGYEPTIFCANTRHNSPEIIETGGGKYTVKNANGVPFVFVKTSPYSGNGFDRIRNMFTFSKNLFSTSKTYAKLNGNPDVILASSPHSLTQVAALIIAKRFGIPCICEVRDLWPESFVAYGIIKKNNPILKLLYAGEKWIYKKADKLIFTMEGGKDYIIEKGWDKDNGGSIDINKVYHINNGVDLEAFDYNKEHYILEDKDLADDKTFKVVYTGSIRLVNKVWKLLDVAKLLKDQNIKFLAWGDGDQLEFLKKRAEEEQLNNVCFKGRIDKKYIPYITTKAQLNVIFGENMPLFRFGGSMNKMFEYFASGKPVLSTFKMGYDIIEKYGAGISLENQHIEGISNSIIKILEMPTDEYKSLCANARRAAKDYDFKLLTAKLINLLETF